MGYFFLRRVASYLVLVVNVIAVDVFHFIRFGGGRRLLLCGFFLRRVASYLLVVVYVVVVIVVLAVVVPHLSGEGC